MANFTALREFVLDERTSTWEESDDSFASIMTVD